MGHHKITLKSSGNREDIDRVVAAFNEGAAGAAYIDPSEIKLDGDDYTVTAMGELLPNQQRLVDEHNERVLGR